MAKKKPVNKKTVKACKANSHKVTKQAKSRQKIDMEEFLTRLIEFSDRAAVGQGDDGPFVQQATKLRKELEELRKNK